MRRKITKLIIVLLCLGLTQGVFDITNYGAVANSDNIKDHITNQNALNLAISAANNSNVQRVIRIPAKTFYTMPIRVSNAHNITFEILGRWAASKSEILE